MSQITKRIIALLMAMAMLVAFVGCGADKADTSSVAETTSSEETNTEDEVEDIDPDSEDETEETDEEESEETDEEESEETDEEESEETDEEDEEKDTSSKKTSSKKTSSKKTSSKKKSSKVTTSEETDDDEDTESEETSSKKTSSKKTSSKKTSSKKTSSKKTSSKKTSSKKTSTVEETTSEETESKVTSTETESKETASAETSSKETSSKKTSSKKTSSKKTSSKVNNSDDDFFGDSVDEVEDTNEDAGDNDAGNNDAGDSNQGTSNSSASLSKYWKKIKEDMPDFSGKTIQVYNWNTQDEYPGLASTIKGFTNATGVKVKWVREDYNTYIQKLTSLIASSKAPDIIRTHSPTPHMWALSQPITVSKFKDFDNAVWDQAFMAEHTVKGNVYAANTTSSIIVGPAILFYNSSLITKYNLDNPYELWKQDKWDVDAFEKILRDYKKATGNAAIGGDLIEKYLCNIYGLKGEIEFDTASQKFVSKIGDARVQSIMVRAADLIMKENLTVSWGLDEFDRGEILMFCGTGVTAKRMNPYAANVKAAGNLGTVPWPTVSGKKADTHSGWGDDGFAIPKGSPNPEIFPYYIAYVSDPERYDLSTYFADDQCVEVFQFLTNVPTSNRYSCLGFNAVGAQFVGEFTSISEAYKDLTGDQIPSALKANANLSQLRADEYNKVLETVGK